MFSAFNMGIGFVLVAAAENVDDIIRTLSQTGVTAYRIGDIRQGNEKVRLNRS